MIKTNIKMIVNSEQSKRVQEICFDNGINWRGELCNKISFLDRPYLFVVKHLEQASTSYDFKSDKLEEIEAELFIQTNGSCEEDKNIIEICTTDKIEADIYIDKHNKGEALELDNEFYKIVKYKKHLRIEGTLYTFQLLRYEKAEEETKVEYNGQILTDMSEWQNDRESGLYYENIQLKKKIENLHIALNKKNEKKKKRALEISRLLKQKEDLKKRADSKHLDMQICLLEKFELHKKIESNKQSIEILANQIASNAIDFKKQLEQKDTIIKYLEDRLIKKQGERK